MPPPGTNPQNALGSQIRRATDEVLKLLAEEGRESLHHAISAYARTYKAFPEKLEWIPGVWLGGLRGQVLVADGKAVLWISIGKRMDTIDPCEKLSSFSIISLGLAPL